MADKTFHSLTLPGTDPARVPDVAAEFNTGTSYAVRDYCTYQGILYRCTTAHTGAWNASHFQATNLDNEFDDKLKIPPFQASAPANPRVGDLWIDTDEDSPILSIDPAPIAGSTNVVQSGGVKTLIDAVDVQKASRYLLTGDFSTSATYEKGQLVFWYPETFSTSHSYVVGESCVHNGVVYKCITAHKGVWKAADFEAQHNASTDTLYRCITDIKVPESWIAAHWQATNINTEINRLRESEADTDMIAENYGDSNSYAIGDYVVHNSDLFRCISAVSDTGSWDPDDWQQVKLANDVSDLKSALCNLTGVTSVQMIGGGYISVATSPIDLNKPIPSNNYQYAVINVTPGEVYIINALGGNGPRAWITCKDDGTGAVLADANADLRGYILTIPDGVQKLIINDKGSRTSYKGVPLPNRVENLETVIATYYVKTTGQMYKDSYGETTNYYPILDSIDLINFIEDTSIKGIKTIIFPPLQTLAVVRWINPIWENSSYQKVVILGNQCTLRNFIAFDRTNPDNLPQPLFNIRKFLYFEIKDLRILQSYDIPVGHIRFTNSQYCTVKNCLLLRWVHDGTNGYTYGKHCYGGIEIPAATQALKNWAHTIQDCSINGHVYIGGTDCKFINNSINADNSKNQENFAVMITGRAHQFADNFIIGSQAGSFLIDKMDYIDISHNFFDGTTTATSTGVGILIKGSPNSIGYNLIGFNRFYNQSKEAIRIENGGNCIISSNQFQGSRRGGIEYFSDGSYSQLDRSNIKADIVIYDDNTSGQDVDNRKHTITTNGFVYMRADSGEVPEMKCVVIEQGTGGSAPENPSKNAVTLNSNVGNYAENPYTLSEGTIAENNF